MQACTIARPHANSSVLGAQGTMASTKITNQLCVCLPTCTRSPMQPASPLHPSHTSSTNDPHPPSFATHCFTAAPAVTLPPHSAIHTYRVQLYELPCLLAVLKAHEAAVVGQGELCGAPPVVLPPHHHGGGSAHEVDQRLAAHTRDIHLGGGGVGGGVSGKRGGTKRQICDSCGWMRCRSVHAAVCMREDGGLLTIQRGGTGPSAGLAGGSQAKPP